MVCCYVACKANRPGSRLSDCINVFLNHQLLPPPSLGRQTYWRAQCNIEIAPAYEFGIEPLPLSLGSSKKYVRTVPKY